jgi:hypothetical protein
MTPPVAPKNQTPFDDEISLLDIIQFFKTHFKRILFFIILGGVLGGLYGKFAGPVYEGSMLLAPAKVAGSFVADPKVTITKLNMNSYYPKDTFIACNPGFYEDEDKDKDKDKDIDYDMSDIVKTSPSKDGSLIMLKMSEKHKETIVNCFNAIENDVKISQRTLAEPLIEMKKNELQLAENKLKISEDFRQKLNDKQLKDLKTNELRFSTDVLYANIVLNNASEISSHIDQLNKITAELSSEQTKDAGKVLPINIERKSFPSLKLGLLLGLFLGGVLGFFLSLFRSMKIN